MKKIVLSLLLLSLLAAGAVYAESGSGNSDNSGANRTVDAVCVSTAVGVREDALLATWSKFDDAITAVFTARKTALIAAWALPDATARKRAVKDAWATAKKSRREATKTYRTERKAAWRTFKAAAKACGGTAGSEASGETDSSAESVAL